MRPIAAVYFNSFIHSSTRTFAANAPKGFGKFYEQSDENENSSNEKENSSDSTNKKRNEKNPGRISLICTFGTA